MACAKITGTVNRTGNLTGVCVMQVLIKRNGIIVATIPVNTNGPGSYPYSYQDNNAVSGSTYTAMADPMQCVCAVSSASVMWTDSATPPPPPPPPPNTKRCNDNAAAPVGYTLDGRTDFVTGAIDATMTGQQIYWIRLIPGPYMRTDNRPNTLLNIITLDVRAGHANREVAFSPCKGDFDSADAQTIFKYNSGPDAGTGESGSSGGFVWTLDEPNRNVPGRVGKINSGRDWYINIRNLLCYGSNLGPDTCGLYWFAIPAANR